MSDSINRVLVHIGFHKTGTSWLQDEVFDKKDGDFHPISKLAHHFVFDQDGFILNSFDMNETVIREELQKVLKNTPLSSERMPVMSYERLSGSPFAGGVNGNSHAARIKNVFPQAKILIVIRKQADVILSGYFQYLTGGGTLGIDKYLYSKQNGLRPFFTGNHYHYHHIVSGYQGLFGKKQVLVLPYELFRLDKQAYLERIARFTGQEIKVQEVDTKVYRNKGEHQFTRYHFRFLNTMIKSTELNNFSFWHGALTKGLSWRLLSFGKRLFPASLDQKLKVKLNAKISTYIAGRYEESNQKLNALIDDDLEDYGYF